MSVSGAEQGRGYRKEGSGRPLPKPKLPCGSTSGTRQLSGLKFRRQQPLGPYVVAFVCFEHRLIIEVDGGHHTEQVSKDAQRSDWIESQEFRVLRFWNKQVMGNVDAVRQAILDATADPSP